MVGNRTAFVGDLVQRTHCHLDYDSSELLRYGFDCRKLWPRWSSRGLAVCNDGVSFLAMCHTTSADPYRLFRVSAKFGKTFGLMFFDHCSIYAQNGSPDVFGTFFVKLANTSCVAERALYKKRTLPQTCSARRPRASPGARLRRLPNDAMAVASSWQAVVAASTGETGHASDAALHWACGDVPHRRLAARRLPEQAQVTNSRIRNGSG